MNHPPLCLVVLLVISSAAVLAPISASAVPVIANASFEDDAVIDGSTVDLLPSLWSKYEFNNVGGTGVFNPNPADPDLPAAIGTNLGYAYAFNNGGGAGSAATLYQQVDTAFAANTTYTLSVLVGDTISNGGANGYEFPETVRIGIYNASTATNGELNSPVATTVVTSPGDGLAAYYTAMFTTGAAPPSGPIVIGLGAINTTLSGVRLAAFDDVTITAVPVPEPGSLAIFGLGMLSLPLFRRKISGIN